MREGERKKRERRGRPGKKGKRKGEKGREKEKGPDYYSKRRWRELFAKARKERRVPAKTQGVGKEKHQGKP